MSNRKSKSQILNLSCSHKSKLDLGGKVSFKILILVLSFAFCVLRFFLFSLAKSAHGQSISLSIWPPLLEVMIQPGRSVTQVYKLTNASDHELQITPQIFPFKPQGENGEIRIKFPTSNIQLQNPASNSSPRTSNPEDVRGKLKDGRGPPVGGLSENFFSFDSGEKFNQSFYLPIGQTREIVLKIALPKDAPTADYYYTLLFSTTSTLDEKNPSSSLSITQIGTNILITVSPTGNPMLLGRILEFSSLKIIDSFSPVAFTVRLENWGKTLWKPFGKIKITGMLKQKDEINLYEQNILAESSRKLDLPEIKPKLPLGPFKASLEFSLNEGGEEKLSAETTFWYLPYKAFFAVFAVIAAIFLIKRLKRF